MDSSLCLIRVCEGTTCMGIRRRGAVTRRRCLTSGFIWRCDHVCIEVFWRDSLQITGQWFMTPKWTLTDYLINNTLVRRWNRLPALIYGSQSLTQPLKFSLFLFKSEDLFPRRLCETHIHYINAVHFHRGQRWTVPCRFSDFPEDTAIADCSSALRGVDPVTPWVTRLSVMWFDSRWSSRRCLWSFLHFRRQQTENQNVTLNTSNVKWSLVQEWMFMPSILNVLRPYRPL